MIDYNEIFKYPILSEVILDLRFPIRFDMPNCIAEFQKRIEKYFPNAGEAFIQNIKLSKGGNPDIESEKVWEFKDVEDDTTCSLFRNKLALTSTKYKLWKKTGEIGFKKIINQTYEVFISLVPVTKFNRIGLRYINKVEIEEMSKKWFNDYFIPLFNLRNYDLDTINENYVRLNLMINEQVNLTIQTAFIKENNLNKYILDFDAFSTNIDKKDVSERIESLHEVIIKEFHSLITEKCRNKMRGV